MVRNDFEYFRQRAAIERRMARSAPTARAAAVHEEMAERYEALVEAGRRPVLHLASSRN